MNPRTCGMLVLASFVISFLTSLLHYLMIQLTFCENVEIPHFFCDPPQLVNLVCSNTFISNLLIYFIGIIFGGVPLLGILYSYARIKSSILSLLITWEV